MGSVGVGLVPEEALLQAAEFYLRIEGFDPGKILERRLEEAEPGGASR